LPSHYPFHLHTLEVATFTVAVHAVFAISMVAPTAEECRVAVVTADNSKRATSTDVALVPTFMEAVQMESARFTDAHNI
jgi:hypothetical protein